MVIRNWPVRRRADDENRNFGEERQLARFEAVIVAERQRDEAGHQAEVPHPGQRTPKSAEYDPNAAQARHQIIALADEQIGEGAHDDAVDMDGTEPAECQPQTMAEIVGKVNSPKWSRRSSA